MREEERRMEKEESRRELERKKEVVEDEIAKEKKLQRVKSAKMSSQCLCLLPGGGVGERDHEQVEAVGQGESPPAEAEGGGGGEEGLGQDVSNTGQGDIMWIISV